MTRSLFEDQEVKDNFKEFFVNSEGVLYDHSLLICGNIACDFQFMYSIIYEEDLYERVNCFLLEKKDNIFDLELSCWFLHVTSKRPLKIYSNNVNNFIKKKNR